MVALVALLVIGPEKLPKVARMAGFWIAKSRRMVASIKQEISEELQAEELRQLLNKPSDINELHSLYEQTIQDIRETRTSFKTKQELPSSHVNKTDKDD